MSIVATSAASGAGGVDGVSGAASKRTSAPWLVATTASSSHPPAAVTQHR